MTRENDDLTLETLHATMCEHASIIQLKSDRTLRMKRSEMGHWLQGDDRQKVWIGTRGHVRECVGIIRGRFSERKIRWLQSAPPNYSKKDPQPS